MKRRLILPFLMAAFSIATTGLASEHLARRELVEIPSELLTNTTFLHGHPDLRWRVEGSRQLHRGDYAAAIESFTRAARHADKPSQAAVAELLWVGTGVARNRALAYAWMDLAAERGYHDFLLKREAMWQALGESEREQALASGAQLYANYGDDVAKPRAHSVMRREKSRHIGSRVGADVFPNRFIGKLPQTRAGGTLDDSALSGVDTRTATSTLFYNASFWHPETYWAIQDRQWNGEVIVHSIREDDGDRP